MRKVIWITGMPRSGTSWFGQIFMSSPAVRLKLCPLFSYEFKNSMDSSKSAEEWVSFFDAVYRTRGEYLDQDYLRRENAVPDFPEKEDEPEFLVIKSTRFHDLTRSILMKHPTIRFISIIRHPCACIHSWLTNPLEFPKDENPHEQWRSGVCRKTGPGEFWGFTDWIAVTSMHLQLEREYPERFIIIRYEQLVKSAESVTQELFSKLGISFSEQTADFLEKSQTTHDPHVRSVFKLPAVVDRWKTEMDPKISSTIIEELNGTKLAPFIEESP